MACSSCGKAGHKSARSRDCEDYVEVEERPVHSTIQSSLPGHLRVHNTATLPREVIVDVLGLASDRVSKVAYSVCVFLNAHLGRVLADGEPVPMVDRGFLTKASFLFVTGEPRQHVPTDSMLRTYREICRRMGVDSIDKVPGTGLSHILDSMRVELLTAISNYDEFALESHIAKYLCAKYGIKKGHATGLASKVFRFNGEPGQYRTLPKTLGGTVAHWNEVARDEYDLFALTIGDDGKLDHAMVVQYRGYMLAEIEAVDTEDREYSKFALAPQRTESRKFIEVSNAAVPQLGALAREHLLAGLVGPRSRGVQGLPTNADIDHVVRATFKNLDTLFDREGKLVHRTGGRWKRRDGKVVMERAKVGRKLQRNRKKKGAKRQNGKTSKQRSEADDEYYQAVGMNKAKWELADTIKTNGVELHLVFVSKNWPVYGPLNQKGEPSRKAGQRVGKLPANLRVKPEDLDPAYDLPTEGIGNAEFTATDPGNTNPFTVAWWDRVAGKHRSKTMSKAQYAHDAGRHKMNKRVAKDRKRAGVDFIIELLATFHFKQTDRDGVLWAAAVRLEWHDVLHAAYSTRQKLKLQFECKRRSARAMDKTVDFLRHKPSIELVAIGDCGKLHGLKGTAVGAPVKKIKRRAVVRGRNEGFVVANVDEGCTSCKSWCCPGHRMEKMVANNHDPVQLPDGTTRPFKAHGILICQGCGKLWARDDSAARNIWEVTWYKLNGWDRPWWLATSATNTSPLDALGYSDFDD